MSRERDARLAATHGESDDVIHARARALLAARHRGGGLLVDVGCGTARLRASVAGLFERYVGVDGLRHPGLPADVPFAVADLDGAIPLRDGVAAAVVALETVEHLENPRAFVRELVRVAAPGGLVLVSTPHQGSLLSRAGFLLHGEFSAFRGAAYPAHRTALLEIDLRRIAAEGGLAEVDIAFTQRGRVPGTAAHYPHLLSRALPRLLSDNVLMIGRRRDG